MDGVECTLETEGGSVERKVDEKRGNENEKDKKR
jgi:hypothetical protein